VSKETLNQAIILKIFEPTHPTLTTHQTPWQTGRRILQRYLVGLPAMLLEYVGERWNYDTCVISLRSLKPKV
jgi:hypothetical protein